MILQEAAQIATANPWSILIGLGTLSLAIGGGILTFGIRAGRTDAKILKHDTDIDSLWEHQRVQDERFHAHAERVECKLGSLESSAKGTEKTVGNIQEDVREIRKAVLGGKKG